MQRLRQQVNETDFKILQLLQQRTKLAIRIGEVKRRLQAAVFVPERERELMAGIVRTSRGKLSAVAISSIYREILSSSRAVQGQAPIGLLQASAAQILLPGRWRLGACESFSPQKTWAALAQGLKSGALSLALLTGQDLADVLGTPKARQDFFSHYTVVDDFSAATEENASLVNRIFLVIPRGHGASSEANRILILIECKSTVNAVKSILNSMPDLRIQAEHLRLRAKSTRDGMVTLVRLALSQSIDGIRATGQVLEARKAAGFEVSILGVYPGTENYGG